MWELLIIYFGKNALLHFWRDLSFVQFVQFRVIFPRTLSMILFSELGLFRRDEMNHRRCDAELSPRRWCPSRCPPAAASRSACTSPPTGSHSPAQEDNSTDLCVGSSWRGRCSQTCEVSAGTTGFVRYCKIKFPRLSRTFQALHFWLSRTTIRDLIYQTISLLSFKF